MTRRECLGLAVVTTVLKTRPMYGQACAAGAATEFGMSGKVITSGQDRYALALSSPAEIRFGTLGAAKDAEVHTLRPHAKGPTALSWAGNDRFVTGGSDGSIRIWSTPYGQMLREWYAHDTAVHHLAMAVKGGILASAAIIGDSTRSQIRFWRFPGGEPMGEVLIPEGVVRSLAILGDGERWFAGMADGRFLSGLRGKGKWDTFPAHTQEVTGLDIFEDRKLVSIDGSGGVAFWTLQPVVRLLSMMDSSKTVAHAGELSAIWSFGAAAYQRGASLVTFGPTEDQAVATGSKLRLLRRPEAPRAAILRGHTAKVLAAGISSDGNFVVSGSEDGTAKIWPLGDGKANGDPITISPGAGAVRSAIFTRDGANVILGCDNGQVLVYAARTSASGNPPQQPMRRLAAHKGPVAALALTQDGNRIVSMGNDGRLLVWPASPSSTSPEAAGLLSFASRDVGSDVLRKRVLAEHGGVLPARSVSVVPNAARGGSTIETFHAAGDLALRTQWFWNNAGSLKLQFAADVQRGSQPIPIVESSGMPRANNTESGLNQALQALSNRSPALTKGSQPWFDARTKRIIGLRTDGSLLCSTVDGRYRSLVISGLKPSSPNLIVAPGGRLAVLLTAENTITVLPLDLEPQFERIVEVAGLADAVAVRRQSYGVEVVAGNYNQMKLWKIPLSCLT